MALVRANNSEFATASGGGKLIRLAFQPILNECKDGTLTQRLCSVITKTIKADSVHKPGSRIITAEGLQKVFGSFQLNAVTAHDQFLSKPIKTEVSDDILYVTIPFALKEKIKGPTHWKIKSMYCEIDFAKKKFVWDIKESEYIPASVKKQELSFEHAIKGKGFGFYTMSVQCYDLVKGVYNRLVDGKLRAGEMRMVN